jgi:hypothetical protein
MAQREFFGKLKVLQDKIDKIPRNILTELVTDVVAMSPDDTGAYVLSHSVGRSGNVGRSISSHGRPSAPNTHREDALAGLMAQVATIPPDSPLIWMGNNAPHVNAVEFGLPTWRGGGYFVYTTLRSNIKQIVADAVAQAGLK